MLIFRSLPVAALAMALALPATAQELQPHRAVYAVTMLEKGKAGMGPPGTYAFELRQTCEGYVINQRMRLEIEMRIFRSLPVAALAMALALPATAQELQ